MPLCFAPVSEYIRVSNDEKCQIRWTLQGAVLAKSSTAAGLVSIAGYLAEPEILKSSSKCAVPDKNRLSTG